MLENTQGQLEYNGDMFFHIANDCCQKWFDAPSEGLVDMLIYPVVGITIDQLRTLIKLAWPKKQEGWQGMLLAADIQNMQLMDFTPYVQVNIESPRISFPSAVIRELKFNGPSLIVATPGNDFSPINPFSAVIPLFRP